MPAPKYRNADCVRSPRTRGHLLAIAAMAVGLAACTTAPPPGGYQVFGKNYVPLHTATGYTEVGRASWYGPGFHGEKTANGETYDMHARTAAHKLLPLGTVVEITDLDSGRTVTARINDRGPFVDGRIIDLSKTLAADLDMLDRGTARVRVTAVAGPGGVPPPRQDLPGNYVWQVGAFTVRDNAERLAGSLRARFGAARVVPYDRGDALFHRVQVGPYPGLEQAQLALPQLVTAGLTPFLVRSD
ncbi:MAG: septal ring lytic transglycosylase RlpA family protein [Deferrisomatales bacterium]|nr:septal ring lytic transglycosylase RlpA family protein [Deferrisomatales bacterium]